MQTPRPRDPGLRQPTPTQFEAPPATQPQQVELPPLLTPDEARQIVDDMDAIDTEQTRQGIWYALEALRAPYLQEAEVWQFVKDSLPLMLASTSPTLGSFEIATLIQPSVSGAHAADILERQTYDLQSVLPEPVKREIARILATSETPLEAWHATDQMLRRTHTSTSVEAAMHLERALIAAQQRQVQQYRQSVRH